MDNRHVVIFDGECNFCNGAVNFIIKRDPDAQFVFTPMQSKHAEQIMQRYGVSSSDPDTLILLKHGKIYILSDAALEIAKDLRGYWYLFNVFKVVPKSFRDWCYRLFARNRYKMFGKANSCRVPAEAEKDRFL
ncbi:thiol-disulfide oxidoreductase DCC family protein [Arsukibacterium indicum]|uniref:Thiol-disulfide oxidoreductase DCC family protein n=1 Tax=Arsukibacterium indicum TaxID=2848612 RepID=A0ABS6MMZ6_9GAMM|nr:thiol-disulfide oxidoreductase DCC family protein [Arsukibacterium indicum]MBV2129677.1 thiol-disulfide oxidoreductase DCC family protein [Arsukibacterium indicum]